MKTKIVPKMPLENIAVTVESLSPGDTFIDGGALFMITDKDDDPFVIDLATGEEHQYGDEVYVVPVDCIISWTKKGKKRKTK